LKYDGTRFQITAVSYAQRRYLATSTSGTSTYTATLSPVPSAYEAGAQYAVTVTSANTGASTMNFNSLGAKTIQANGAALLAGQLQAGVTYQMIYDGTNLQVTNNVILVTQTFKNLIVKPADEARFSNVTPADDTDLKVTLLSGKTYNITIVASFNAATTGMHLKANSAFTGTTSQLWVNGTLSVTSNIVSAGRAALNNHLSYTPGTVDANTPVCAIFNAMLITTSTGVFSMQWSQGITSVSNLTCLAGSYLWAISN
jgi:hypothetical protein